MNIGFAIKKYQESTGIGCLELSTALGVLPQQLSRWRQAEDLKLSTVLKLCEIFNIEVSEFIDAAK